MNIFCKELNKEFTDKVIMFNELYNSKEIIIESKKAQIIKSIDKGSTIVSNQEAIQKAFETNKALKFDNDYYYFVVNSANILDSHGDVHVEGNWKKTVKEQQGKVYLVFDHKLERSEIIAMRKDIELLTANIPFSLLGKNYEGETYSLIYKIKKDKIINQQAKEWLDSGYDLEASVRMQYVNLLTAFNSKSPEHSKEKETFDTYFPLIANKSEFKEIDYFWVVKEAKNVMESSLVLFGSNNATGLINQESKEEPTDEVTQIEIKEDEPTIEVTQTKTRKRSLLI
jgi:hypothetical protein